MEKHYETPENNVKLAALKLLRHKMLVQIAESEHTPTLYIEDLNEAMLVAGLPLIVPDEVRKKVVEVIE